MSNDLISIIVPVYNIKPYLQRCFDSLIKQTYKNIEILLIDDGSTDGSSELCDSLKKSDSRVFVIHKQNGGVSSARNAGLDSAKGEYISFVDPDDYVDSEFIEELHNLIEKNNVLLSVCTVANVNEKGRKEQNWPIHKEGVCDYNEYLKIRISRSVVDKMFHKSLFKELRFPENIGCSEDGYIYYKLIYNAKLIARTSRVLYFYFQRSDSLTHIITPKSYFDIFSSHYNGIKYLVDIAANNDAINNWYYFVWSTYMTFTKKIKKADKNSEYLQLMRKMYDEINSLVKYKLNFFNKTLFKFPHFMHVVKKIVKFFLFPIIFIRRKYRRS